MGLVKNNVQKRIRNEGSIGGAQQKANKWFINSPKKADSSIEIIKSNQFFTPGKIYIFGYFDPVTPNLPWWDKNPVNLSLGMDEYANDIGINLNLLPYRERLAFLDFIYELYKSNINKLIIKNVPIAKAFEYTLHELNYYQIKPILKQQGWDFAIRSYKTNNRTNPFIVGFTRWVDVVLLDLVSLVGKNILEVYNDFINHKKRIK